MAWHADKALSNDAAAAKSWKVCWGSAEGEADELALSDDVCDCETVGDSVALNEMLLLPVREDVALIVALADIVVVGVVVGDAVSVRVEEPLVVVVGVVVGVTVGVCVALCVSVVVGVVVGVVVLVGVIVTLDVDVGVDVGLFVELGDGDDVTS